MSPPQTVSNMGAMFQCPNTAALKKKALSLSFYCHVQLSAEQREREEDWQRHDDHQSQRGADGESRR